LQNNGPSYARNAGWDAAVCPYIAFLDADDSWHPEKLAIQYNYMNNHHAIAMSGHRCVVLKDNSSISYRLPKKWKIKAISKSKFIFISYYFATRTVMLKRNIDCRFPEDMRYSEDRFLWMEIIAKNNKASFLDVPLAYSYKEYYGQGGLTKNLWKMEQGEFRGLVRLYNLKLLNLAELFLSITFSVIKFMRRVIIVAFRVT